MTAAEVLALLGVVALFVATGLFASPGDGCLARRQGEDEEP